MYSIAEVIKTIEDQTKKEVLYVSLYKTGEVKEITFNVVNFNEFDKENV